MHTFDLLHLENLMRSILFSTAAFLLAAGPAFAQGWGDLKGQIIWDTKKPAPKPAVINVDKDQQHCLGKGPLVKDDLVIDAKTGGVKNVMVWLAPAGGGKLPIHPNLQAVPNQKVVIDQPLCAFVPRITMMREGQELDIKNSAPITHNTRITGNPEVNGTTNLTIPPGGVIAFAGAKALKAEKRPLQVACDIHGWMGGRLAVFDHPYFALTKDDGTFEIKNAPAGKFVVFIQHEKAGWLHTPREKKEGVGGSAGQPITIPAGGALNLGKIELKADYLK
jgi:hypothetical protein